MERARQIQVMVSTPRHGLPVALPSQTLSPIIGDHLHQVPHASVVQQALKGLPAQQSLAGVAAAFMARWEPDIRSQENQADIWRYGHALRHFGPSAADACPWLGEHLERSLRGARTEYDHPAREAMAHALIACGSTAQVTATIPRLSVLLREDDGQGERLEIIGRAFGETLAGRLRGGIERGPIHTALANRIGSITESLGELPYLLGRIGVEIGDGHPVTRRWVDHLVQGTIPSVNGKTPPPRMTLPTRVVSFLSWCEQRVDQGATKDLGSSVIQSGLCSIAFQGAFPNRDGVDEPVWRERAGRLVGLLAAEGA
jgi:hypothetical protein